LIAHISLRITSEQVVPLKILIVSSVPEEGAASISEVVFNSSSWQDTIYIDIIGVNDMYDEDDQSYTIKIGPTNTTGDGYNNFEFSLDYINVDDDAYGRSKVLMYREAETCCSPGFPLEQQEDALQEKQRQREKPTTSAQLQSKSDMSRQRMNIHG
jgi:hypothetical protein